MKKNVSKLLFLGVVLFAISFSASAQIYVTIRPTFPVVVRPVQPSPAYVWVNEEWQPDGNTYRYSGGHWEAPSHPGYYRRQGHWVTSKHGQRWVPGGWYNRGNHGKHGKHGKH
ncbi:MAG: hypothetical protein ABI685_09395 [Ferruginibacter sp.]